MQIERLVLYSKSGERRELEFRLGELNVITGASQTGKSSLTNIFRYCLGSSQAGVPVGAISSSVAWYGLVVVTEADRRHFLGRPAPEREGDVSDAMLIVEPEGLPTFDQLTPNTTRTELREYLGSAIGIEENLNVPAIGQTRRPLAANFRHSLYYCFQGQGEIANPDVLFHHQNRIWQSQAIKDTLPYFLGAQGLDDLRRRQELTDRRRELRKAEQRLARAEAEEVTGVDRSEALLLEASDAALVDKSVVDDAEYDTSESAHAALRSIVDHPIEQDQADTIGVGFEDLRAELAVQRDRARDIANQLRGLDEFDSVAERYKSELTEHRSRLASIGLIPEAIVDAPCPVCGKQIGDEHDSDSNEVASELATVASRLKLAQRDEPRVEQAKSELREERRETLDRIDELNASLTTLAETNELVARERQRVNLQSYVRGKVAQYLESLVSTGSTDLDAMRTATKELRDSVTALEDTFDPALVRSRVDSALSHVNRDLTDLAQQLELEHAEHGVRLDPNRLTVVADPPSGPAYLDAGHIGSGLNWVGYHLATYLSMQTFFIKNRRPVPSFVLIDQPSQAFFPSDRAEGGDLDELTDTDRENTKRLYRLMNDRVQELSRSLQLIVLDHADFDDDWFDLCVVERWRDGNALIPASWLNQVGQAETDGENRPDANDA